MSSGGPNLDGLIRAHREGAGMTHEQRARNRARVLGRALAGVSSAAAATSAGSAAAAKSSGTAGGWLAKTILGIALTTGTGVAYIATRATAPVAAFRSGVVFDGGVAAQAQAASSSRPASLEPVSLEPATAGPAVIASSAARQIRPVRLGAPVASRSASPEVHDLESSRAGQPALAPASLDEPHGKLGAPVAPSSLAAEVELMHKVESSLRAGQPADALALLDEPHGDEGLMGEERAAARVVTLCQLGRVDSARTEAARFLRDRPHSPLAARVRATCTKPSEGVAQGKVQ
jgi:hypothetical protein